MKAVFESNKAYLHLSKGAVNNLLPVQGQAFIRGVYTESGKQVGTKVDGISLEFYTFRGGENHNQLTLTDAKEIENMREYIERRHDAEIKEIVYED